MNKRFHVLDGFRGIFACIVALYHFKPGPGYLHEIKLISHGWFFVDFFFVLSGFVIIYNYNNIQSFAQQKDFIIKRLLRLYPLHISILIVFVIFETLKYILYSSGHFSNPPFEDENLISFIANVFLLQSYGIPIKEIEHLSWNTPSWSISAEFFSYIIFCIIIVRLKFFNLRKRVTIFILLSTISVFLLYMANNNLSLKIGANFGIFRCSYSFFLGCIACELYKALYKLPAINRFLSTMIEAFCLTLALILVCYLPNELSFLAPLSFFLCIIVFAFESGAISNLINNKFINKLGTLSYSIYMINALVSIVFEIVLLRIVKIKNPLFYDLMIIPYLLTLYFTAKFTYKYFEIKGKEVLQSIISKDFGIKRAKPLHQP